MAYVALSVGAHTVVASYAMVVWLHVATDDFRAKCVRQRTVPLRIGALHGAHRLGGEIFTMIEGGYVTSDINGRPKGLNSYPTRTWERTPKWHWRWLIGHVWRKHTGDYHERHMSGILRSGPIYEYRSERGLARETLAKQFDPDKQAPYWAGGEATQAPPSGFAQQQGRTHRVDGNQNRLASQEHRARLFQAHGAPNQRAIPSMAGVEGVRNRPHQG